MAEYGCVGKSLKPDIAIKFYRALKKLYEIFKSSCPLVIKREVV